MTEAGFEAFEHTADLGLRAWAPELPELFRQAALGMLGMIADPSTVALRADCSVEVGADDREALLVEWLSEINFQHTVRHQLYAAVEVDGLQRDPWRVRGRVRGEVFDPERHVQHTELKAVTFHDLRVEEDAGGWRAQVIFDV